MLLIWQKRLGNNQQYGLTFFFFLKLNNIKIDNLINFASIIVDLFHRFDDKSYFSKII